MNTPIAAKRFVEAMLSNKPTVSGLEMGGPSPLDGEPLNVDPAPEKGHDISPLARMGVSAWMQGGRLLTQGTNARVSQVCLFGSFVDGDPGVRDPSTRVESMEFLADRREAEFDQNAAEIEREVRDLWEFCLVDDPANTALCLLERDASHAATELAIQAAISDIDGHVVLEATRDDLDKVDAVNSASEEIAEAWGWRPLEEITSDMNWQIWSRVTFPFPPTMTPEWEHWFDPDDPDFGDNNVCWTADEV